MPTRRQFFRIFVSRKRKKQIRVFPYELGHFFQKTRFDGVLVFAVGASSGWPPNFRVVPQLQIQPVIGPHSKNVQPPQSPGGSPRQAESFRASFRPGRVQSDLADGEGSFSTPPEPRKGLFLCCPPGDRCAPHGHEGRRCRKNSLLEFAST